ncbi:MAG: alcohol dehydrogenase catalytic domain-containing protein, partial [Actinomycetota bacterium]|nr:alcohol dehydrogenase catalytic domain-containing protein [Actinomycetota bacterium]
MRAVALTADGRLEVVDKPDPVPGLGEVVVAVERCGICGSDLHLKSWGMVPVGAVMGHEFAGTIAAVGAAAPAHLAEGQRVAVLPAARCGSCRPCRSNRDNLCELQPMTAIGLGVNDGAHAEYVRVPAAACHPLPAGTAAEHGALVEPYAVALHAVRRSAVASVEAAATLTLG